MGQEEQKKKGLSGALKNFMELETVVLLSCQTLRVIISVFS